MNPDWIAAIVAAALAAGALFGWIFKAGQVARLGEEMRRDVNGLGRKYGRLLAFQLRSLSRENPISREKLLDLADLLDPK